MRDQSVHPKTHLVEVFIGEKHWKKDRDMRKETWD